MESPEPATQVRRVPWIAVGGLLLIPALTAALLVYFYAQPKVESDLLNVPLGVEQAAIVTYSGPPVTVTPYKWGVAVNVRIARVIEEPGSRVYDVRYIVNRAGTFDIKDYLSAEDGTSLDGLPSFKFHGDPKLSKELDARIQETEDLTVKVGGYYTATLTGLAAFWIVWLLLLIFYGRPKRAVEAAAVPAGTTLAEMLRGFQAQLKDGTLDSTAKAKMEMLLLRRWRQELALSGLPMIDAMEAIQRDEKTGRLLRQLQDWLHRPSSPVRNEEIAAALSPYTVEPESPQPS
ncbi:MAG: hypothetical protein ACAI34_19905 [Verrucomicrobium sp.]